MKISKKYCNKTPTGRKKSFRRMRNVKGGLKKLSFSPRRGGGTARLPAPSRISDRKAR